MRDSVPSGSYSSVCNVLRQWQSRSSLLIESTDSMIQKQLLASKFTRTYETLASTDRLHICSEHHAATEAEHELAIYSC